MDPVDHRGHAAPAYRLLLGSVSVVALYFAALWAETLFAGTTGRIIQLASWAVMIAAPSTA